MTTSSRNEPRPLAGAAAGASSRRRILNPPRPLRPFYAGDKWFCRTHAEAVGRGPPIREFRPCLAGVRLPAPPSVTPRGPLRLRGAADVTETGASSSAWNVCGCISRRLTRDEFVAVVEPGVLTATLQEAVELRRDCIIRPEPGESRPIASLGWQHRDQRGRPRCLKVRRDPQITVLGPSRVITARTATLVAPGRALCNKNKTGFRICTCSLSGREGMQLGSVTGSRP
jgi:hypothetical protein